MRTKALQIAGLLILGLWAPANAHTPADPPLVPYLAIEGREAPAQSLEQAMADIGVTSLSYLTIVDGKVATTRVIGEAFEGDGQEPRFQAASISKPVSALGILRLADLHGLDIDADINDYLKGLKIDYSGHDGGGKVTIRRLLSHRAGLKVSGFPGYEPEETIPSTLDVLEGRGNTEAVTLFQTPGSGFSYSGGGYTVLQLLVEEVAGGSFADFMEREVLVPLGMVDSHFRDEPGGLHPTAKDGKGQPYDVPYHVYPEKAAAALWTTAPDLARFLIAADAITAGDMPDMLSPELASQWLTVPEGEGPEQYALGFGVERGDGYDIFRHNGSNFGFKSEMFFDRVSKNGFVAMVDGERGYALNSMLARGFAHSIGLEIMEQRKLVPVAVGKQDWAAIEGVWTFPDGPLAGRSFRFASLSPSDMRAVEIATGEASKLLAIGPMEFIDTETTSSLVFEADAEGKLEAIFAGRFRMVKVDP